jgi:hypothetical protein
MQYGVHKWKWDKCCMYLHQGSSPLFYYFPELLMWLRWKIQVDQKVSVHLNTIQNVTSNVQSVPSQSPDIYWHTKLCSRRLCSVWHDPHFKRILWWPSSNHQLCVDCLNKPSFFIRCKETFWSPCISPVTCGDVRKLIWNCIFWLSDIK